LHASTRPDRAGRDVGTAAAAAVEFAGDAPLIFGGDLNLRPAESDLFGELERRHGLAATGERHPIDRLLVRGLVVVEPPCAWPPERREVSDDGLAIRLSDHDIVAGRFAI